jgi:hypothetical protein
MIPMSRWQILLAPFWMGMWSFLGAKRAPVSTQP